VRIFNDCKEATEAQDVADRSNGLGLIENGIGGMQAAYVYCPFQRYFCRGRVTHKEVNG
jgi:hypothetical protein